jgi:hypothetical protein
MHLHTKFAINDCVAFLDHADTCIRVGKIVSICLINCEEGGTCVRYIIGNGCSKVTVDEDLVLHLCSRWDDHDEPFERLADLVGLVTPRVERMQERELEKEQEEARKEVEETFYNDPTEGQEV